VCVTPVYEKSVSCWSSSVGAGPSRRGDAAEVVAPLAAVVGVGAAEDHRHTERESANKKNTERMSSQACSSADRKPNWICG
jgi:hypothetical protein